MGKAARNSSRAFKRAKSQITNAITAEQSIYRQEDNLRKMLLALDDDVEFQGHLAWLNSGFGKDIVARSFLSAYAWIKSNRVVFDIDSNLLNALAEAPPDGIPIEVFDQLPYPTFCFYAENLEEQVFDVYIYHKREGQHYVTGISTTDELLVRCTTFSDMYKDGIVRPWTTDVLAELYEELGLPPSEPEALRQEVAISNAIASILSYLASDKPDISMMTPPEFQHRPNITGASLPSVYRTGWNVGAALSHDKSEASLGDGNGVSVRPHIRKAHWHLYWTGPKTNPKPLLKWLPPIAVNAKHGDPVKTTRSVA